MSLAHLPKSIEQGQLPLDWKTAHVTPVHKSGSQHSASNYRPISLTSIPCKLLKHIILGDILEKIDGLLHNRQHGFRRGLSCETQLCATFYDIHADKDQSVHAAIFGLTKAIDSVPHALLVEKLSKFETINGYLLLWTHNFLLNRSQCVILNGKKSLRTCLSCRVYFRALSLDLYYFCCLLMIYQKR